MNKFEELQSTIITGTQFIKSYPMLNLIDITPPEPKPAPYSGPGMQVYLR